MNISRLLLIILIASQVNSYPQEGHGQQDQNALEKTIEGSLFSQIFSTTKSIFMNFLNHENFNHQDSEIKMEYLQRSSSSSSSSLLPRSPQNQSNLTAHSEKQRSLNDDLFIHSQNQAYQVELLIESPETTETQQSRILNEDKQEYDNGDNEDVFEDMFAKYVKEGIDESIQSILYNDYWAINYFQSPIQGDKIFDSVYKHVPAHLVYTKTFNNKTYRIIRFPRECAPKAQKVIQRSFWYYCQDRKVFVADYIKLQRSGYNCYKRKYYTERCFCPLDKFGVFCSQQSKLVCQSGLSIGKNEVIKTSQSCNGVCPNEISKNKRSGLYSASFTSLTDGDQKMIDFKVYLDCHNSIPLSHRFNELFYKIEGLCPESLGEKEDQICDIKPFEYALNKTDNGILLSDPLQVKIQVSLANWLHISQPLQLERTIESATVDILSGEKPANLLVDLETIQDNGVDIQKYLQFGKLWYKIESTVIMNPDDSTEINVTAQKFNGLILTAGYNEPKISYLERLLVQKIGLELILVIATCIVLLALAGGIITFLIKKVKKWRLEKTSI